MPKILLTIFSKEIEKEIEKQKAKYEKKKEEEYMKYEYVKEKDDERKKAEEAKEAKKKAKIKRSKEIIEFWKRFLIFFIIITSIIIKNIENINEKYKNEDSSENEDDEE
jgi:protein subunit release factor B